MVINMFLSKTDIWNKYRIEFYIDLQLIYKVEFNTIETNNN